MSHITFKTILSPNVGPDILYNKEFFTYFPKEYYDVSII